jgi:DNA primase
MDRIQLQKLRDLPIEGVAERLGLRVTRHKALCPFHDDHHASLSFKVSKNTFRCFVCGASGGTIDLVMRHLGMDFPDACRWLAGAPLLSPQKGGRTEAPLSSSQGRGEPCFNPERYVRFFERPWLNDEARRFLFDERRLDPRVVRWCRLTSWKDRQGVPWLQIPYYDRQGKLIGVQNRNLVKGASPRFRFPSGSQCTIYNLPVLNLLKPGDELWITEGCSDCWAMLSAGHKAIAIPSATLLKRRDIELLRALTGPPSNSPEGENQKASPRGGLEGVSFHMYPDRDAPGERLFLQLKEVLPSLEHHQLPPGCKDFSDYYLSAIATRH